MVFLQREGFENGETPDKNGCTFGVRRGVLDVWQAKDLRKCDCGSVAITGLTGEISEVWQMKKLGERQPRAQWDREVAGYGTLRREWCPTIKVYVSMEVPSMSRYICRP